MRKNGIFFFLPEVIFYKNISSGQKNSSAQCSHAHFFRTINTFKESLPLSFIIGLSKISNAGEPARACWEHRGSLQEARSSPSGHSFLQEAPWRSTLGQFPCVQSLQSFFPLHLCLHWERKWFRNTLRQSFFLKPSCPSSHPLWRQLRVSCQTPWAQFPYHFPGSGRNCHDPQTGQ